MSIFNRNLLVCVVILLSTVLVFLHVGLSQTSEEHFCPKLQGEAGEWPKWPVKRDQATSADHSKDNSTSECFVNWKNREYFIKKVSDRLANRQKQFFRFRIPAGDAGIITVVWVTKTFQPMLHYPQNFETLSLATMNIVTQNMDEDDIKWTCTPGCNTCMLPKKHLEDSLMNVSKANRIEWKYLCIQAEYGMSRLFLEEYADDQSLKMLNARNFALPDMLYYWNFLKMLFITHRSPFGFHSYKEDFPNYYCYNYVNECVIKELHIHYWVVVYLALALWLYSPLLIYYFPSQKPCPIQSYPPAFTAGMFPSYKSPVHLSRCFQKLLCYYTAPNSRYAGLAVRIRRIGFLVSLAFFSFRLFIFYDYIFLLFMVVLLFASFPKYVSYYVQPEVPKCFPLFLSFPYQSGIICWNNLKTNKVEYQLLAYVMQERMFLIFDLRFWKHLCQCSFHSFCCVYNQNRQFCDLIKLVLYFAAGIILLALSLFITVVYFVIPMPYFIKEICIATYRGEFDFHPRQSILQFIFRIMHGFAMLVLFFYIITTSLVVCYLIADITMYTYMGSSLTPGMAVKYVSLAVSCGTAIYSMVHTLHDTYNSILTSIIDVLTNDSTFSTLQKRLTEVQNMELELLKDNGGVYLHKIGEPASCVFKRLVSKDSITSYVSREAYFTAVDWQLPIRRQFVFLILKATLAVTFILLAMMVKNVYHLEKEVEDIFSLASQIALSFLPATLQFLVYKNKFGHKSDMIQKRDSIESLVIYISNIKI